VPRFEFTLQAVLDHRERIESEKQRRVAELERQRVRLEEVIRECHRGIVREQEAARSLAREGDIAGMCRQTGAITRLHTEAQRGVIELAGTHRRLDGARAELLEATVARKSVELLRDRRYEAWKREQDRKEQAAIDELAVLRAAWKDDDA
jgi:flagellar FliJ protein